MRRVVSEQDIKDAIFQPPQTTRAFFRGRSIAKFNAEIATISWDEMVFMDGPAAKRVDLDEAFGDPRIERLNAIVREMKAYPDFMRALEDGGLLHPV
jgi:proteasome accessory factor A